MKLRAHLVRYTYKLVSTRRVLVKTYVTSHHQGQEWGIQSQVASHPPDPH